MSFIMRKSKCMIVYLYNRVSCNNRQDVDGSHKHYPDQMRLDIKNHIFEKLCPH